MSVSVSALIVSASVIIAASLSSSSSDRRSRSGDAGGIAVSWADSEQLGACNGEVGVDAGEDVLAAVGVDSVSVGDGGAVAVGGHLLQQVDDALEVALGHETVVGVLDGGGVQGEARGRVDDGLVGQLVLLGGESDGGRGFELVACKGWGHVEEVGDCAGVGHPVLGCLLGVFIAGYRWSLCAGSRCCESERGKEKGGDDEGLHFEVVYCSGLQGISMNEWK